MASLTPRIDKLDSYNNTIINGNFDFDQRHGLTSTSISGATYNTYVADRFTVGKDSSISTLTAVRTPDVPTRAQSGFQSTYSLLVTNGTGVTPASLDGCFIAYRQEGYDFEALYGNSCRLSFWVKSSITGTYSVNFSNKVAGSSARLYTTTYTISSANTWQKVTTDLTMDTAAGWSFDNSIGLVVYWTLACGTGTQTSTLNAWQTATFIEGATGQTNWAGTTGATFQIAQVSLVAGSFTANDDLPFKRAGRTIQAERGMCLRYFEKSFEDSLGLTPGVNAGGGIVALPLIATNIMGARFSVPKRAVPNSIITYGGSTGTQNTVSQYGAGDVLTSTSTAGFSSLGFAVVTGTGSMGLTTQYFYQWVADAEL